MNHPPDFWTGRRVVVTGAGGLIGSWTAELLAARGAQVTATVRPGSEARMPARPNLAIVPCDLECRSSCLALLENQHAVFSLAHADGSAEYKRRHPASLFRRNLSISLNLMEAAAEHHVERILLASSAEVYSAGVPEPATEADGFRHLDGTLTDGYSWSKRMTELSASLYAREHGIRVAIARPSNVYGPRDSFDPARGRVIPMFIRRILAGEPLTLWGDGQQVRTFLFVEDFARGAIELLERGAVGEAVNFAGLEEISIIELARLISRLAGRDAVIECDSSKPSGVVRRVLNTDKARALLQFEPRVGLEEGLRRTIDSFIAQTS